HGSSSAPYALALVVVALGRPPDSALFPYTTLFRSERHAARGAQNAGDRVGPGDRRNVPRKVLAPDPDEVGPAAREHVGKHALDLDRKSTRLNSSHRTISYAVCCLKKTKAAAVSAGQ